MDYNNNGGLDSNIDLLLTPFSDGRICVSELIDQTAVTPCEFYGDVNGESSFSATESSSNPHVNYTLSIPKSRLSDSSTANVVIRIYDGETGGKNYPETDSLFVNTLEFSW
ncbi:MAG: hypothetical protein AAGI23_14360 [Bacteroidota bacterium]